MSAGIKDMVSGLRRSRMSGAGPVPLGPVPSQLNGNQSEEYNGQPAVILRSAEFRRGREKSWQELDCLVSTVEKKGIGTLNATEVGSLPLLYRAAVSSLSVARSIVLDRHLLLYLESLCLRAYLVVYGPRTGIVQSMKDFFLRGFPRAVRGMRWHFLAAVLATLAGAVAGYLLVRADMSYFTMLVPEGLAGGRGPGSSTADLKAVLFSPWRGFIQTFIVFANSLFRHNTLVGLLCFGLGLALGVPTILLLAYNGLILGAFVALHVERGLAVDFVGWLSIHGVTELLAIFLCGGAGLVVAENLLFPGSLPRLESLARYGRRAASVAAGCVLLFFIAGFLEGGFRQLINNTVGRYAFALSTGIFWLAYFVLCGREERWP